MPGVGGPIRRPPRTGRPQSGRHLLICAAAAPDGGLNAPFSDSVDVPDDVPLDVVDEVTQRTPGFHGWQHPSWLYHRGDGAAFLGPVMQASTTTAPPTTVAASPGNTPSPTTSIMTAGLADDPGARACARSSRRSPPAPPGRTSVAARSGCTSPSPWRTRTSPPRWPGTTAPAPVIVMLEQFPDFASSPGVLTEDVA
ncbi:CbrC family protein [Micromonospora phytophila]|uniref:CbrC family protein n=1 Tax=Micromonospora phytophila TaxID=709888 RepID=UPI003556128B